jgi:hypothetical protein
MSQITYEDIIEAAMNSEVLKELYPDEDITQQWIDSHEGVIAKTYNSRIEMHHIFRARELYNKEVSRIHKQIINLKYNRSMLPPNADIIGDIIDYNQRVYPIMRWLCLPNQDAPLERYYSASIPILHKYVDNISEEHAVNAARIGCIEVVEYILDLLKTPRHHDNIWILNIGNAIVDSGYADCVQYLIAHGFLLRCC